MIAPRDPDADITRDHEDVAAGLQACLPRPTQHLTGHFGRTLGLSRLALAGGVALNTTANARLLEAGLFEETYVQQAAADDGTALGAALQRAAAAGEVVNRRPPRPFFGPSHGSSAHEVALGAFADQIEITKLASLDDACARAAELIADAEVLAWYRERMEFGPRALGHRSILADPGREDMRGSRPSPGPITPRSTRCFRRSGGQPVASSC